MNIAHILNSVSDHYCGIAIGTRGMVSSLARIGVDLTIWATGDSQYNAELTEAGICTKLFSVTPPDSWWRSPGLAKALKSAGSQFDIFHIHSIWAHPQYVAAKIARNGGIPYIVAPRAALEPWQMRDKGFKKNAYMRLVGNTILRNASCLHAVTPAEVDGFRQAGFKGPVFIAHNGINPRQFENLPGGEEAEERWPILKEKRVVLFMSRLSGEKGLDQLVPAWASIVRQPSYADALLVIAGPDYRGYQFKIRKMIQENNIQDRVLITGMVRGADKFALMARADIFALPSYSEGFSNSLLENLAAGTPALITSACNFAQVVAVGAGLCVEPERSSIESGLKKLLDKSKQDLSAMGERGRRLVIEEYTWEKTARKIATVYKALLYARPVPLHPKAVELDGNGRAIFNPAK